MFTKMEVLYGQPLWLIFLLLIGFLLSADEVGYRVGNRQRDAASDLARSQFSHLQGALFGLFALLLGFSFAMALSRFDDRQDMVVEEANAIGTVALDVQLLPDAQRSQATDLVRRYVDLRVEARSGANLLTPRRLALDAQTAELQDQLWQHAVAAAQANPQSVPAGLFLQAVSDMGDAKEERDAALANHVPESVLFLLFVFAILTSATVGYGNALAGGRALGMAVVFTVLIVNVLMVILDLDRPGRGVIQVNQEAMFNLQKSVNAPK
jgi:hypothetical protein